MTRLSLAVLALGGLLSAPAVRGQTADGHDKEHVRAPAVPDTGPRPDLAKVVGQIVERTNAFRKEQGRKPVATNPALTAAAGDFAGYMARTDEYGHEADGRRPADRVKAQGYSYCLVLENIAYAFDSRGFAAEKLAEEFATGWEKSPGHRRNMLDPDVTDTGVAVARSETTGHYYAVQLFGRPKSAAVEFKIDNRAGEPVRYTIGDQTFTLPPRHVRTHTLCRPAGVTFRWPGEGAKPTAVTPAGGDTWVVTRDADGFRAAKG